MTVLAVLGGSFVLNSSSVLTSTPFVSSLSTTRATSCRHPITRTRCLSLLSKSNSHSPTDVETGQEDKGIREVKGVRLLYDALFLGDGVAFGAQPSLSRLLPLLGRPLSLRVFVEDSRPPVATVDNMATKISRGVTGRPRHTRRLQTPRNKPTKSSLPPF